MRNYDVRLGKNRSKEALSGFVLYIEVNNTLTWLGKGGGLFKSGITIVSVPRCPSLVTLLASKQVNIFISEKCDDSGARAKLHGNGIVKINVLSCRVRGELSRYGGDVAQGVRGR